MLKENIYNELYEQAKNGEHFTNLMPLILSEENILLAYSNIKQNSRNLSPEEVIAKVRYIVSSTKEATELNP